MLIPCLYIYILSYNVETLKEVAFLTCDYHNQYYITTTVNNLMTVLISGVSGQKSSQSLTALSILGSGWASYIVTWFTLQISAQNRINLSFFCNITMKMIIRERGHPRPAPTAAEQRRRYQEKPH